MSAILSADDLNDFINPGVACIKPIETIPKNQDRGNSYEVTTEEKAAAANPQPATISLTDCLACSGCVTSAEAVLVSLQSHTEVLTTLDGHSSLPLPWEQDGLYNGLHNGLQNGHHSSAHDCTHNGVQNGTQNGTNGTHCHGKIFVASISPQARANIAAAFGVSEKEAGNMITQLLAGSKGLKSGGARGTGFTWVLDTNVLREAALVLAAEEVTHALSNPQEAAEGDDGSITHIPKKPILTSACPGWICYAEKTHPYVLPHLSRMKSPQALAGTLIKSVLAKQYNVTPDQIWHLAVMPCFDKKLEASRSELTSAVWSGSDTPIRDVDCVITARELLMLATGRGIDFSSLPRKPVVQPSFPDPQLNAFLFPRKQNRSVISSNGDIAGGTSGGYLYHILQTHQTHNPGSSIRIERGRNADVVEYTLVRDADQTVLLNAARFYGFRNIQNLVRRLKPAKLSRIPGAANGAARRVGARRPGAANGASARAEKEYAYVEVMACPGGCTNGGGQIKAVDVADIDGAAVNGILAEKEKIGPQAQREWLGRVDEAYFSASSDESQSEDDTPAVAEDSDMMDVDTPAEMNGTSSVINGIDTAYIRTVVDHWASITGVDKQTLVYTSYRKVESDVGKKVNDVERVAGLASSIGGGW